MPTNKSSDLEFHVNPEGSFDTKIFKNIKDASFHAISMAISHGQTMHIDVITWTRTAARKWAGDSGVEVYDEDPEASVHERIVVKAHSDGRIA
jgi:hypothetical protein